MSAPFLIRKMADCVSLSMIARCSMENMPPSGPGDHELVSQPCSTCTTKRACLAHLSGTKHAPSRPYQSHSPSIWPCPSVHSAGRPTENCCLHCRAASSPHHAHRGIARLGTDDGGLTSAVPHHLARGNWGVQSIMATLVM